MTPFYFNAVWSNFNSEKKIKQFRLNSGDCVILGLAVIPFCFIGNAGFYFYPYRVIVKAYHYIIVLIAF